MHDPTAHPQLSVVPMPPQVPPPPPQTQAQQPDMPYQPAIPLQPLSPSPSAMPVAPRPEDAATHITVSDPVQHQDGMSKFTSYRVDVRPPEEPGSLSDSVFQNAAYSAVLRRYSDFLWLYERLHQERAGAVVPPLPEKQAVSRFTTAFVEQRRADLEIFIRRVAVHPELGDAQCLGTFLRADDVTFRAAKVTKDASQASAMMTQQTMMAASGYGGQMNSAPMLQGGADKGIKRWFSEATTAIAGDLVRSPDDDLFEEIEQYVAGLDHQMRAVSSQAGALTRKAKELANGMFEFGLAFQLLGRSEADVLGSALSKVGDAADSLSVLSAEHAEKEAANFEKPLEDYVKTIHAVRLALSRRHERRLAYTARLSELNAKQAGLMRLRSTLVPGQEGRAYTAEMSLQRGQAAAEAAQGDFMAVSQRVLREVDRFKREKAEDMKRVVYTYIEMQVEYNRKMEHIWADLIPILEQVPFKEDGDANVPTPTTIPNPPGTVVTEGSETASVGSMSEPSAAAPKSALSPAPAALPASPPAPAPAGAPPAAPVTGQMQSVSLSDPNPMMGSGIQYRP